MRRNELELEAGEAGAHMGQERRARRVGRVSATATARGRRNLQRESWLLTEADGTVNVLLSLSFALLARGEVAGSHPRGRAEGVGSYGDGPCGG